MIDIAISTASCPYYRLKHIVFSFLTIWVCIEFSKNWAHDFLLCFKKTFNFPFLVSIEHTDEMTQKKWILKFFEGEIRSPYLSEFIIRFGCQDPKLKDETITVVSHVNGTFWNIEIILRSCNDISHFTNIETWCSVKLKNCKATRWRKPKVLG